MIFIYLRVLGIEYGQTMHSDVFYLLAVVYVLSVQCFHEGLAVLLAGCAWYGHMTETHQKDHMTHLCLSLFVIVSYNINYVTYVVLNLWRNKKKLENTIETSLWSSC